MTKTLIKHIDIGDNICKIRGQQRYFDFFNPKLNFLEPFKMC